MLTIRRLAPRLAVVTGARTAQVDLSGDRGGVGVDVDTDALPMNPVTAAMPGEDGIAITFQ